MEEKITGDVEDKSINIMECPKCHHRYGYVGQPYTWEHCPIGKCGYQGKFEEFVVKEHKTEA